MAVVYRVTLDSTGDYKIANAGEGASDAGWQISFVSHSWSGTGTLKQNTAPPGSAVSLGSAVTYYDVASGASASAAITSATSKIVQDTGSDLYFSYTHTSGSVTITVGGAGELVGQDDGMLPVFNPAFTGTLTGPTITASSVVTAATFVGAASNTTGVFTSSSASALAVGPTGTTDPVFVVDASAGASVLAGLKVTGATSASTVAVAVQSPGSNASLTLNAKGTGTIGIGSVSTGAVTITPATTITGALTLAGVCSANSSAVSTSTTTGSIVTSGGLGVGGALYAGGAIVGSSTLAVTGTSTLTGNVGIGGASTVERGVNVVPTAMTGTAQTGMAVLPTFAAGAPAEVRALQAAITAVSSAFTTASGYTILASSPNLSNSAVTTIYGLRVSNQGQAKSTTAYGVYIDAQSGAGITNIGLYNAGTTTLAKAVTFSSAASNTYTGIPTSSSGQTAGMLYSSADGNGIKHLCIV